MNVELDRADELMASSRSEGVLMLSRQERQRRAEVEAQIAAARALDRIAGRLEALGP